MWDYMKRFFNRSTQASGPSETPPSPDEVFGQELRRFVSEERPSMSSQHTMRRVAEMAVQPGVSFKRFCNVFMGRGCSAEDYQGWMDAGLGHAWDDANAKHQQSHKEPLLDTPPQSFDDMIREASRQAAPEQDNDIER